MVTFCFNIQKSGSTFLLDYDNTNAMLLKYFVARVFGKQNLKNIN